MEPWSITRLNCKKWLQCDSTLWLLYVTWLPIVHIPPTLCYIPQVSILVSRFPPYPDLLLLRRPGLVEHSRPQYSHIYPVLRLPRSKSFSLLVFQSVLSQIVQPLWEGHLLKCRTVSRSFYRFCTKLLPRTFKLLSLQVQFTSFLRCWWYCLLPF